MIGPADVIRCDACGEVRTPFEFGPMLHDHIWQQITEPGERTLCAKYMDQRTIKRFGRSAAIVLLLLLAAPASAQDASRLGLSRRRRSRHRKRPHRR